jgi:double-strand break repair protein MRE11
LSLRVKRGSVESVPEGMFDDCIDLVVWGHEHDCRILPEPVTDKSYFITQPGSTVATSLADGESLTKCATLSLFIMRLTLVYRHCALLEVQGKNFEITPVVLRTVRPFKLAEVILTQVAEEEGLDLTDKIEINKYLKKRINELILQADEEFAERNADAEDPPASMLPLIRLKVGQPSVLTREGLMNV